MQTIYTVVQIDQTSDSYVQPWIKSFRTLYGAVAAIYEQDRTAHEAIAEEGFKYNPHDLFVAIDEAVAWLQDGNRSATIDATPGYLESTQYLVTRTDLQD